ncbi:MAG TPA: hypothetical protein VFB33_16070 [Candidatus Binataceae bacterium]|nr:hypothetical protein [Candidatus Binataceae bacterium]
MATRMGIALLAVWCAATAAVAALPAVAAAADESAAARDREVSELRAEVRAMRAQLGALQERLDALTARLKAAPPSTQPSAAGAAPSGAAPTAARGAAPAQAAESGLPAPPPGVTPAGTGVTPAGALKSLMPGELSGPTARQPGFGMGGAPQGQGVIIPSVQGVPKVFIPDIGGVGDITFQQSDLHRGDPRYNPANDQFVPRDTQLIFFSPIDPYTNAQISIDKPNDGPFDIEEAFLVFHKLPWGLNLRIGQYRSTFGLLNGLDTFQLPVVNRPDALAQYIGPDGFINPGVNLSAYVPNPWELDLKADLNVISGQNTLAFDHRNGNTFDFAYIGSLMYSRELFTSGSMLAGFSMAGGPGAGSGGQSYLEDPFLQIQYAPDQRHIWTWSAEGLLAERANVGDHGIKRGVYTLLDYNFWLRYHAALLLDMWDVPGVARGTQFAASPLFTYFVSDNTRLRMQYTHATASGPMRAADFVYLQATFSLGNLKPLD